MIVSFELAVANAMKVLQACIYKSVKGGLFFKSFVATSVDYFILKTSISTLNLTTHGAIIDIKLWPVLQTCKYRPV